MQYNFPRSVCIGPDHRLQDITLFDDLIFVNVVFFATLFSINEFEKLFHISSTNHLVLPNNFEVAKCVLKKLQFWFFAAICVFSFQISSIEGNFASNHTVDFDVDPNPTGFVLDQILVFFRNFPLSEFQTPLPIWTYYMRS